MKLLNRWLDKTDYFFNMVSSITLFVLMFWIFTDVILRYVFNKPLPATMEITGEYFMVIIVFLALSHTQKLGAHINVEIVSEKLPEQVQKMIKLFSNILIIAMLAFAAYANFKLGLNYLERDIRSASVLAYPKAPAVLLISLGFTLFTIRLLLESIQIATNFRKAEPEVEVEFRENKNA